MIRYETALHTICLVLSDASDVKISKLKSHSKLFGGVPTFIHARMKIMNREPHITMFQFMTK